MNQLLMKDNGEDIFLITPPEVKIKNIKEKINTFLLLRKKGENVLFISPAEEETAFEYEGMFIMEKDELYILRKMKKEDYLLQTKKKD